MTLGAGFAERDSNVAEPAAGEKKMTLNPCERTRPDVVVARALRSSAATLATLSTFGSSTTSGVNLSLTRSEAGAPRGERVVDNVPSRRVRNYRHRGSLGRGSSRFNAARWSDEHRGRGTARLGA